MTPQETDTDLSVSVQKSLVEAWVGGGLLNGGGTSAAVSAWELLKEVDLIFIISTIVGFRSKNRREHSHAHQ